MDKKDIEQLRTEIKQLQNQKITPNMIVEIAKLLSECRRLRIKCGPEEMIESDYMEIE